jgi:hypothetical protein
MDADDAQQHRHMSRFTAEGLKIFYDACIEAGLPESVSGELTVEQYRYLLRPEMPELPDPIAIIAAIRADLHPEDDDDD